MRNKMIHEQHRLSKATALITLSVSLVLTACAHAGQQKSDEMPKAELCLASSNHQQGVVSSTMAHELARVQAELALTEDDRARGLMHREHLEPEEGMLFYYPNSQYRSFWMFNTLIPLDIAYLADDGEILQIMTMQPCESESSFRCKGYQSDTQARAALELNAGAFVELGVDIGDYVLDSNCQQAPWAEGW